MKKAFSGVFCLAVCLVSAIWANPAYCQWKYEKSKDKMTDKVTVIASLPSPTSVQLGFPYGAIKAWLIIEHHGGETPDDVKLYVSKGQLLKREGLTFRFDDAPPLSFETVGTASGSSNALYVYAPFARHLNAETGKWEDGGGPLTDLISESKRVRVQATFYNHGSEVFEFKPQGLKWPK